MSETPSNAIWIVTDETPLILDSDGAKSGTEDIGGVYDEPEQLETTPRSRILVESQKLKQEMSHFLKVISEMFSQAEQQRSQMQLDEIELSVEINGQGQVSLLGIGASLNSKGAMKLKFKRATTAQS